MAIVADELMFHAGHLVAWSAIGLLAGWLANKVVRVAGGGGYGVSADLALGVLGALAGGVSFRLGAGGEAGIWGGLAVALVGACVFLAGVRIVALGRKT